MLLRRWRGAGSGLRSVMGRDVAVYYNELDSKAAAWLRELIKAGMIAPGDVDERSIIDVQPNDLAGYTQCHFFAGVGGWSIAARLAGWPDDREIWTGSCPCQPFSVAGKGAGAADARHLWPDFFRLIRSRRPAVVMGEQVAAAVGENWLDGVFDDLEGIGYACEAAIAPACAVNAPHRRDRLWFVAGSRLLEDATGSLDLRKVERGEVDWAQTERSAGRSAGSGGSYDRAVPNTERERIRGSVCAAPNGTPEAVCGIDGERQRIWPVARAVCLPGIGDVADSHTTERWPDLAGRNDIDGGQAGRNKVPGNAAECGAGHWDSARWLIGHDGKARRVEPSIPLLVDGIPARAPLLRGYGNAIVPALAAEVIGAWMDCNP